MADSRHIGNRKLATTPQPFFPLTSIHRTSAMNQKSVILQRTELKKETHERRDLDMITERVLLIFITKTRVRQQTKDEVFISQHVASRSHALDGCKHNISISAQCHHTYRITKPFPSLGHVPGMHCHPTFNSSQLVPASVRGSRHTFFSCI